MSRAVKQLKITGFLASELCALQEVMDEIGCTDDPRETLARAFDGSALAVPHANAVAFARIVVDWANDLDRDLEAEVYPKSDPETRRHYVAIRKRLYQLHEQLVAFTYSN